MISPAHTHKQKHPDCHEHDQHLRRIQPRPHRPRDGLPLGFPLRAQTLALSPGLSYAVTHGTRIYGFVQLPVYQYVNGVQLTADVAYVAGVTTAF